MSSCKMAPYIKYLSEKVITRFPGICYQCNFNVDGYSDSIAKTLLREPLHESLSHAITKRRAEFVAGRYLARKALTALGSDETTVGIGSNRTPIWPEPFIGSISHSDNFVICAVVNKNDVKKIGIDVENILTPKVATEIVSSILIEAEYDLVGSRINPTPVVLTIIFSAKESLFKALYPEVGHYFDFNVAQLKEINFETGIFSIQLVQQLSPALPLNSVFEGTFEISKGKVFTIITC